MPLEVALEPRTRDGSAKLASAWEQLGRDHAPHLRATHDAESGLTRLAGMTEHQLNDAIGQLADAHDAFMRVGALQVAYLEAPGRATDVGHTHARQSGPTSQFARVVLRFEPAPGSGVVFENAATPGTVPPQFLPGVEKGVQSVAASGPLAGFPVHGLRVTLLNGAWHDADSSPLAFQIAARAAFREAADRMELRLLEPVMRMQIFMPQDFAGSVVSRLSALRGEVLSRSTQGSSLVVEALAPLANLFGYADALRRETRGLGQSVMLLAGLAETPSRPKNDDLFPPAMGMRA